MVGAVKQYDAVTVVVDVVVLYPAEPGFDSKDPLRARLVDQIIQDHSVCGVVSTVGYVCFVVLENIVLLYVS